MQTLLITFFSSFIVAWGIVILADKKSYFLNHQDLTGVQKIHLRPTPHVGGLAVVIGFAIGIFFLPNTELLLLPLLLASLPTFFGGLIDDISSKVEPFIRLLFTFTSITISFVWLNIGVNSLGFEWIDYLFANYMIIGLLFTLLVVGGTVNSFNIIDGYNGLMPGYAIIVLLAISFVAYSLGDDFIMQLALLLSASIFGFLVLNFPFGKIFIGDGGAYFVGFMTASIGLLLVDRHQALSNWFILLLFIYPLYETAFSIIRRKIFKKTGTTKPDARHLHSLIYKKIIISNRSKDKKKYNNITSPFLWALSLVGVIPAVIWYDNKIALIAWAIAFMIIYTVIYRYVVNLILKPTKNSI
ncbi:Undecaprenyl-phosphate N-acetylglucosaminyl 1-phosphate transferase [uncultured Candidatus Thioglobus sp.]|nr:Undecaprenyl-phosphate N-acetylglucosaminyl 1-phosphate transferase [uncultured Candidatus Thioglobus sp.]